MSEDITAVELLVAELERAGIRHVFGVPGSHILPLFDAIGRSSIELVLAKNEAAAAFMACGYAQVTGRIGVCAGTTGPGATNLLTGVAAAWVDSLPMLVLCAQVGTKVFGKGALQEGSGLGRTILQRAMFEPVTKHAYMEVRGGSLPEAIRRALTTIVQGRPGPVYLEIPADVQVERIDASTRAAFERKAVAPSRVASADPAAVREAVGWLLRAERPAILLGGGGVRAGDAVIDLAERLGIPVATTLRAKGAFPEGHPLSLGSVGLYGTKLANWYLRNGIDVLLSIGASFHEFTTHCWDDAFAPARALLQLEIDPAEIGKNYRAAVGLVGDAQAVLDQIRDELGDRRRDGPAAEIPAIVEPDAEKITSSAVPIKPQRLMHELDAVLPRETIVMADIGNHATWAERLLARRVHVLSGLAAMGSATAACVGAAMAAPGRPVVCITGDGCFMMTGLEVATAVERNLPIVWVVLKDERLGMVYDSQTYLYGGRHVATTFRAPDFARLARSLGAEGFSVRRPEELASTLAQAVALRQAVVVEVEIDPDESPPFEARRRALGRSLGLE